MNLRSLGNRIRAIRLQRGLNQNDIADELGISDVAYSKIERGLTNVSIMRLDQIANCLHVSLSLLIDDADNEIISKEKEKKQTDSLENRVRNLEISVKYLLDNT